MCDLIVHCLHQPVSRTIFPVGWGSTYCFTAVSVRVGVTPITKRLPCSNCFCGLFFVPKVFDFCYNLGIWAQGQVLRAFLL